MKCSDELKCGDDAKGVSLQGWFMRLLHRYTAVNYKRFMNFGIHPGQLPFLKIINEQEGISQRELAERLHVKPPTVAVTVKRLEKAEIICRRPDPDDMRISRIYLAEKGKAVSESILAALAENERVLTSGFTDEEIAQMKGFFIRMIENLDGMDGADASGLFGMSDRPECGCGIGGAAVKNGAAENKIL